MNDTIRLGLIGCGGIVKFHLDHLVEIPEAAVTAVCDTSHAMVERMAQFYPYIGALPFYQDYKEMLAAEKLDAVLITTPHTLHFQQIMDSFDAGLHVLTEKPMVTTSEHALAVITRARQAGKVLEISYQRHLQPEFVYLRDLVTSGALGELQYYTAFLTQNWYNNCQGKWRQSLALSGGGQLNDSGSHILDIMMWVLDMQPAEVFAYSDNFDTEVDINTAVTMRFPNGAMGTINIIGNGARWWEDQTYAGAKATVYYRDGALVRTNFGAPEPNRGKTPLELPAGSTTDRNFVDAILGRDEVRVPPECGLRVIRLTEAIWQSAATGQKVKLATGE